VALRAGSYNGSPVWWRGVIYQDSVGVWACTHRDHDRQQRATECGRKALAQYRENGSLPDGWVEIGRG
jgi:hypothetical protein